MKQFLIGVPEDDVLFVKPMGGFAITSRTGSTFPAAPLDGDIWFDSGRKIQFYWDQGANEWLSTQVISLDFSSRSDAFPITASNAAILQVANPFAGQYALWIESAVFASYLNTTGDWTASIRMVDSTTVTVLAQFNRTFGGVGQWTNSGPVAVAIKIADTVELFQYGAVENSGAAQFYGAASLNMRLVG